MTLLITVNENYTCSKNVMCKVVISKVFISFVIVSSVRRCKIKICRMSCNLDSCIPHTHVRLGLSHFYYAITLLESLDTKFYWFRSRPLGRKFFSHKGECVGEIILSIFLHLHTVFECKQGKIYRCLLNGIMRFSL